MDLSFLRRRSALQAADGEGPRAIEDGAEHETRLIGQELVPVVDGSEPVRMREEEVQRGEGVAPIGEEQVDAASPELIQDLGYTTRGMMASGGERTHQTAGELRQDLALRSSSTGGEKAEEPMTPLVPEELWPGGPTSQFMAHVEVEVHPEFLYQCLCLHLSSFGPYRTCMEQLLKCMAQERVQRWLDRTSLRMRKPR